MSVMSRSRRRCRGGRVTPKGTRPAERRGELLCGCPTAEELLLRDGSDAAARYGDLDEAEVWASSIQTLFHPGGLACGHALSPSRVLAAAECCDDTAAAAAVAVAVAVYGPRGHRRRADRLLRRLAEGAAPIPPWANELGRAAPLRAVLMADSWGDHRTVWVDFKRLDGEVRGVSVELHAAPGGAENSLVYGPPIEHLACGVDVHPHAALADISLADARATAEAALEVHDRQARLPRADMAHALDNSLRALVDQRVALLPGGGVSHHRGAPSRDEVAAMCAEFMASCPPEHAQEARSVFEDVCRFVSEWGDGDPLCWSPCRVRLYVAGWIESKAESNSRWHDAVESVLPRWLRFAGERRGLDEERIGLNLKTARDGFSQMVDLPAGTSGQPPASGVLPAMVADGVDLDDEDAVRDWIQRNRDRFGTEFH